jgi:pimeloyl-ACP methyl ester carboxylesterase
VNVVQQRVASARSPQRTRPTASIDAANAWTAGLARAATPHASRAAATPVRTSALRQRFQARVGQHRRGALGVDLAHRLGFVDQDAVGDVRMALKHEDPPAEVLDVGALFDGVRVASASSSRRNAPAGRPAMRACRAASVSRRTRPSPGADRRAARSSADAAAAGAPRRRASRPMHSSLAATASCSPSVACARCQACGSPLAVLDIVPTATIYGSLDQHRATSVWRYFFLIQPPDLPERLIGARAEAYLDWTLREWCDTPDALSDRALAEYRRCFDQATISASCEDYRAGATIDLAQDRADAGRRIACPVLVLWSQSGIGSSYHVLTVWREEADDVRGRVLDCGHLLAEERPDETAAELVRFLQGAWVAVRRC